MKQHKVYPFGEYKGVAVERVVLENDLGYTLSVMTYGATLLAYETPDAKGRFANIVVATPRFEEYVNNAPRWGATIGPVAGRITNATFNLNGKTYTVEKNDGNNHLHGGSLGYEQVVFEIDALTDDTVTFKTVQENMAQGYPGNITLKVTYALLETGEMTITYDAMSDQDTLFNPTNHSYFNLTGEFNVPIDDHVVTLASTGYTVLHDDNTPTGEIDAQASFFQKLVKGVALKEIFEDEHMQIASRNGIDHAFVLDHDVNDHLTIMDPTSGRQLVVTTTSPAVVIYTSNGFNDTTFIDGHKPVVHHGMAIETQILPDAINQVDFGEVILRAHTPFYAQTRYIPNVTH